MLILSQGTGHLVQIVTDAAGDIESDVSYVDKTGTGPSSYSFAGVGQPLASITTATTTTTITGASSTERAIERLSYYNNHASQAVTCTIQVLDGTDTVTLAKCVLAAGETLMMDAVGVWTHYDANGAPYVGVGPIATQAEMEAGASLTTVVSPGRLHYHPGVPKCWGEFLANSTTIETSYNISSVADTATGAMTVTIATDFSTVDWACQVTRSEDDLTLVYSSTYDAKTAGTVILRSAVEAGSGSDPTAGSGNASWSMTGMGDH